MREIREREHSGEEIKEKQKMEQRRKRKKREEREESNSPEPSSLVEIKTFDLTPL